MYEKVRHQISGLYKSCPLRHTLLALKNPQSKVNL